MEPHLRAAPGFGSVTLFFCIVFVCMSMVNVHIYMCAGIEDENKNAYKVCICEYSKYQKVLASSIRDMSTPWIYTMIMFSLILCAFIAGS